MTEEKSNAPIATERKTKDVDYEILVESAELLSQSIKEKDFNAAFYHIINCGMFLSHISELGSGDKK